jgi:alpha-ketoglutarate-dependent taurine dioxygenase
MIEKNIKRKWGAEISITPEEFFSYDANFWREKIYERKILIFKQIEFTKTQYVSFCKRFGNLWNNTDYHYSRESSEPVVTDEGLFFISPFSNIISKKLGNGEMPWHADIPNRTVNPYPMRSLWITKNPFPQISGKTSWMNLEMSFDYLTQEQLDLLDRVTIVQQSWYEPGTDIKEFPFIKIHPITGQKSLRLNYYNNLKKGKSDAWIIGVKIDGELQKDCSLIEDFLRHLEKESELVYEHTWDTFDLVIYDNWSFVHKRTQVIPGPGGERHFYRVNIDHVLNEQGH